MPRKGIPDRWLDYSKYGLCIPGTSFVAFKVPLNLNICGRLPPEEQWTPPMLFKEIPKLGMVIDFTNTSRYYDPAIMKKNGVSFVKIQCQGHGQLPPPHTLDRFYDAVDDFLANNEGRLIGVHCTHGLNRTGLFICRYMIDKLGFQPQEAITAFNEARGHPMERLEYINELKWGNPHPHSQPPETDVGNSTRRNVHPHNNPNKWKTQSNQLPSLSFESGREIPSHTTPSRNHNNESSHSLGPPSRPPEAFNSRGSRILFPRNVQHQPYPSNSFQGNAYDRTVPSNNVKFDHHSYPSHNYDGGTETSNIPSNNICAQYDQPAYPNQLVCPNPNQPVYPNRPVYRNPNQPVYRNPNQPAYPNPNQPAYPNPNQPVYPNTNQPIYTNRNQPVFPNPNQPVYPNPNQPLYPNPNQPVYPNPNQPVYPNPNQPVYPNPNQPVYHNQPFQDSQSHSSRTFYPTEHRNGSETRDSDNVMSPNDTSRRGAFRGSMRTNRGYNHFSNTSGNYSTNIGNNTSQFRTFHQGGAPRMEDRDPGREFTSPVPSRNEEQVRRGSRTNYRRPYRPFRRRP